MPPWLSLMLESLPSLLWATVLFTVPLTLLSFVFGLTVGFLGALARLFAPKPLAAIGRFYVWIFRGTPLLVQRFLIFYGLRSVGSVLAAVPAAPIGLTLNVAAYRSEIVRAALGAIQQGEWEPSYSIGMTWGQAMRRIILP